jgi:acetylornithine/succinyldiaminopimelate/putrescine aminotransferase
VLLLGKALGGGMPLGAFIADKSLMDHFTDNPVLGHITTFGGHPVCCAAGMAGFEILLETDLEVKEKEDLFLKVFQHPCIKEVRSFGLWIAIEFESFEKCKKVIDTCIDHGLITDWFLFASNCLRISPPLTISFEEIEKVSSIIKKILG